MKFPFLSAACLLLSIITILAGCSSSPSSPGTITLSSRNLPVAAGTPVQYTDLSQLVLSPEEIPFVAIGEGNGTPDITDPAFSRFGAIRGYTHDYINEESVSPTAVQLGQIIVEYPPGNASLAFTEFVKENMHADQTQYNVTLYHVSGLGNESIALTIVSRSDPTRSTAMIVFRKSNIMESVVMIAPKPDTDALTRAARRAAAKIPP